jgi:hypothetical protein
MAEARRLRRTPQLYFAQRDSQRTPASITIWRTRGRERPTTLNGSPSMAVTYAPPIPSIVKPPATRCGSPVAT